MRVTLHIIWSIVIFFVLLGLTTLLIASFLDAPVGPQELGYMVGRKIFWLLGATGAIVFLSSKRGWLPGLPRRRAEA